VAGTTASQLTFQGHHHWPVVAVGGVAVLVLMVVSFAACCWRSRWRLNLISIGAVSGVLVAVFR